MTNYSELGRGPTQLDPLLQATLRLSYMLRDYHTPIKHSDTDDPKRVEAVAAALEKLRSKKL